MALAGLGALGLVPVPTRGGSRAQGVGDLMLGGMLEPTRGGGWAEPWGFRLLPPLLPPLLSVLWGLSAAVRGPWSMREGSSQCSLNLSLARVFSSLIVNRFD